MSKSSDTLNHGFLPEVPSPWARDPEVRAALSEGVDEWRAAIPPIARGEEPAAAAGERPVLVRATRGPGGLWLTSGQWQAAPAPPVACGRGKKRAAGLARRRRA